MKKRLRKKLHLGEFKEYGFSLRLRLAENLDDKETERALDALIDQVEAMELAIAGGCSDVWEFTVARMFPGSVTEDQRDTLVAWAQKDGRFVEVAGSPLHDAFYEYYDWDTNEIVLGG